MDATLLENEPLSMFRKSPSPEVDAAWEKISNLRPIMLSRNEVIATGKDPNKAVRFDDTFGLGNEAFAGRIDVFHQIHCLDAIRRDVHWDYYYDDMYPKGRNHSGSLHKLHLSHCIYLLLQNIMCNANVDVYTHTWNDAVPYPFADFNINHQCRDFDAILEWQEENSVDMAQFLAMRRPAETFEHKMSHSFKEVNGYYRHHPEERDEMYLGGEIG
jgi:Mycotoxin biosynthesis protein UstYa